MNTYYDKENNRLVQVAQAATPDFWDKHWDSNPLKVYRKRPNFIISVVKKFLKQGRILEGGCGLGDKMYLLQSGGYQVTGVDYAQETVDKVKQLMPSLDVRLGDVRQLPFDDECFDAYLSLGVIEHFYKGYEPVIKEIKRVLKSNGLAFVTFPVLSLLRRQKIKHNRYPLWQEQNGNVDNFYQFVLDHQDVISCFKKYGFKVKSTYFYHATKGLKDEISLLSKGLQKVYDSPNIAVKVLKRVIDKMFSFYAAHLVLIVFSKN